MSSSALKKNIRDRLVAIIVHVTEESSRFKALGEATGVHAATWRTFWNRGGGASGDMIEGVSSAWPQYAFWLATGITDPYSGHVAPPEAYGLIESSNVESQEAIDYFKYQMELLFAPGGPFKRPGLDLSALDNFDIYNEMGEMDNESQEVPPKVPADLSMLDRRLDDEEDPEWKKKYEEAKARLENRRKEERRNKLDFLRKRKFAAINKQ